MDSGLKICLPEYDKQAVGGGWTFILNLSKTLNIYPYDEAGIYFIPSASMVSRDDVNQAKQDGKKIVLRVDNIIRNSRNRNSGMSRMKDYAEWSDLVIYQSEFAKNLLDPYLNSKNNTVILNSCDESYFHHPTNSKKLAGVSRYLYARSSTDETKNWDIARMSFQASPGPKLLTIIGKPFKEDMSQYNYDFYQGEDVKYLGEIRDKSTLAEIYRNHDYLLYSYFQDACSNTLIEALCSGMKILNCYGMAETGGAPEIIQKFNDFGPDYFRLSRMGKEYETCLQAIG